MYTHFCCEKTTGSCDERASSTYVITNDSFHFVIVHEVARALKHKTQMAAEVLLLEDLLVGHVKYQAELHKKGIEELWTTTEEDLATCSTLVNYPPVLAIGNLDGKRPARVAMRCRLHKIF
jgi:hypothetical protein